MQKCGGFGKISFNKAFYIGYFQLYSTIFLILAFGSSGNILYCLPYLELYPAFECKDGDIWKSCNEDGYCSATIDNRRIDYSQDISLEIWMESLDLYCKLISLIKCCIGTPKYLIGLIGSMFFVGWTVGCIALPRLADLYGRKWFFIISIAI